VLLQDVGVQRLRGSKTQKTTAIWNYNSPKTWSL
jgi:hypothetical protein